jgi:hypothetical protein
MAVDFRAQCPARFQLAVYLALQAFDCGERVASGPKAFERFSQHQLH